MRLLYLVQNVLLTLSPKWSKIHNDSAEQYIKTYILLFSWKKTQNMLLTCGFLCYTMHMVLSFWFCGISTNACDYVGWELYGEKAK